MAPGNQLHPLRVAGRWAQDVSWNKGVGEHPTRAAAVAAGVERPGDV